MKVSIIVAAYNIENYIKRCMDSIVSQTFKDIEIIVVNDGSTDNTSKIIESFANNDKRIKTIDKQNEGLIEARKSGLKIACGEYILFLDGDDWLHTQAIEKLYKKAIQDDSDIVLYNFYLAYDSNKLKAQKSFEETVKYEDDYLKLSLTGQIGANIWAKFLRREFLIDNNIEFVKDITYAEDVATTNLLFMYSPKVSTIDENLHYYYQRGNSVTKIVDERLFDIPKALNFIKLNLEKQGLYEKYKEEYGYLYYKHIYFYQIISATHYIDIHKKLYKIWKSTKIDIRNNKYFIDFKDQMTNGLKVKIEMFDRSYYLGVAYIKFRSILKNN
ncbi:MAG: glycosyltransferase family 2 protein [Clostridia bacterium]|uniref:glycosyltransferase family 2 protein n=1 Tax=Terrisporobacter sp. TaxID=1965305 RepID=UPI002F91D5E1